MEAMYPTGKTVPLDTLPLILAVGGGYAIGLTDIKLKMRRSSDGFVLDWGHASGPTFVDASGAIVQLLQVMTEFGVTFPGEYNFLFDPAAVSNLTAYDTYYVTVVQDSLAVTVGNVPQVGQFRVAPALDDAVLARKALYNDQTLQPGDINNLVLKDDDQLTDLASWNVKDPGGLAVTIGVGAPAIRERTT